MRKLTKTEEDIVTRVQDLLEKGVEGWKKGWATIGGGMPFNALSKVEYKGINAISLFLAGYTFGYDDPRWLTFKQIHDKGYHLEKGAKAANVEFWSRIDKDNRIVTDEYALEKEKTLSEEEYKEWLKGVRMLVRNYNVFNASCVPELAKIKPVMSEVEKANKIEKAETIIQNCFVPITYGGSRAYYSPSNDDIHLPQRSQFYTIQEFYGTALHEMIHATGHESRLNRKGGKSFGDQDYAKEELVAELGSMFMQAELGVQMSEEHFNNHVAYLQSWKKAIKDDPAYFIQAITPAKNATDFILGVAKVKEIENKENENTKEKVYKNQAEEYRNAMTPEEYWKKKNLEAVNKCDKGIPEELKAINAWCAYKVFVDKDTGARKKFILDCHKPAKVDGKLNWAKCNDPATWSDYPTALQFAKDNNCVGLSLALDPSLGYSCIDLDHVIDDKGKMSDVAWIITDNSKDTYIERSTSGTGLHVFIKGSDYLSNLRNRNEEKNIEFYDKSKFISMTGDNFNGITTVSEPNPELIEFLKANLKPKQSLNQKSVNTTTLGRTDDQVLDKISRSTKANDFNLMYKAGVAVVGGDRSKSDASLINMLYFFSRDEAQVKRLFMSSALYRPEKGEKYVDRTINYVVSVFKEPISNSSSKVPQSAYKNKSKGPVKSK